MPMQPNATSATDTGRKHTGRHAFHCYLPFANMPNNLRLHFYCRFSNLYLCAHAQILVAESYGGRDEPVDTIIGSCVTASADTSLDPLRVRDTPTELTYQVRYTLLTNVTHPISLVVDSCITSWPQKAWGKACWCRECKSVQWG